MLRDYTGLMAPLPQMMKCSLITKSQWKPRMASLWSELEQWPPSCEVDVRKRKMRTTGGGEGVRVVIKRRRCNSPNGGSLLEGPRSTNLSAVVVIFGVEAEGINSCCC